MTNEELKIVDSALREARYFARDIRKYLYLLSQERELTAEEEKMWGKTHNVHIHTDYAEMLIQDYMGDEEDW